MSINKKDKKYILKNLKKIFLVMETSVLKGLKKKGVLPGPLKLKRKAHLVYKNLKNNNFLKTNPINFLTGFIPSHSTKL